MTRQPTSPNEIQLERMLTELQPHPTERLYRQIDAMPWHAPQKTMKRTSSALRVSLAIAAVLTVVLTAFLTLPPLRALAQEVIDGLFNRANSDVLATTGSVVFSPADYNHFPNTVAELEQMVGEDIFVPTFIPSGYAFFGGRYNNELDTIELDYRYQDTECSCEFIVRRFGAAASPLEIGASAAIEIAQVGDVAGEYVQGTWRARIRQDSQTGKETFEPAQWIADPASQRLRWREGEFLFEISAVRPSRMLPPEADPISRFAYGILDLFSSTNPGYLDRSTLIAIAESVQ